MSESNDAVSALQYELMLLSRYHLRPNYKNSLTLERSAYILLNRLEHVAPMTLKELSEALHLDNSTIHRQVAALLRHGHVTYVSGHAGEVARRIAPTEEGIEALDEARARDQQGLHDVVGDWSPQKRRTFQGMLRDFNEAVERIEGASWPRP